MGSGVSRLEDSIREMEKERKADWNNMWDAMQENRDEINSGKEREKIMVQLMKQFQKDQNRVQERYVNGTLNKSDFMSALSKSSKYYIWDTPLECSLIFYTTEVYIL